MFSLIFNNIFIFILDQCHFNLIWMNFIHYLPLSLVSELLRYMWNTLKHPNTLGWFKMNVFSPNSQLMSGLYILFHEVLRYSSRNSRCRVWTVRDDSIIVSLAEIIPVWRLQGDYCTTCLTTLTTYFLAIDLPVGSVRRWF